MSGRIFEEAPPSPRFAKGLLLVIAGAHLVFGWGAHESPTVTWLYQLWPPLFGFAALACLAAAARFTPLPVSVAGALTVVGYCSRAAVIVMAEVLGRTDLTLDRVVFGAAVWLMLAVYAGVLWLRAYGPLAALWARRGY